MSDNRTDYLLDINKVLGPELVKKLPRFAINFLKRRIHQDDINGCIMTAEHYKGVGFFDEALNHLNITFKIRGEENLDLSKRYLFVCNHPLGGPEALIIGSVFRRLYGDGFMVPVNHILANLKPLREFFVPVKVYSSRQSRELGGQIAEMFQSDRQVLVFPAGLCARKIKGKVTEMPWKKMFVTQAKRYERDVVPMHISGFNSKKFFFFTKLSMFLKLKFNIGMLFLVDELFKKSGEEFIITIGKPVPYTTFDKSKTDIQWAAEIQNQVKKLSEGNGCPPNM
ncbi:MAG: 1-acyl-sn-glycerol-3-phosphate acyltransferase [Bacteroidales bacterium]|nr:1-acyl-sn-glycerol-3-phosphate acyltransferase [Bacteroidales bacterium]